EEFADRLEATGVEYKPQAYRRAAENVREYRRPVAALAAEGEAAVAEIDRVGDAIASKITEYVETGRIEELEELRAELPVDMAALTRVEGVGPKTVGTLYEELGIETLDDLEAAAEAGEIREIHGFGPKTERNIADNVAFARQAGQRTRLGDARPVADDLLAFLRDAEAVERAEVAGSIRRWRDTVGDVDVLVASDAGERVIDRFTDWSAADDVIEAGEQKASVRADGVRVDVRVVADDEFGAALQYFTGSMDHNVVLRNRAIDRDLKINEYGVFDVSSVEVTGDEGQRAGERLGGRTESEIYEAVGLPTFPPEIRQGTGEFAAADEDRLPELVTVSDVRGDCHTHTDWSDGEASILEMARAAADRGYDFHCVTDHAAGPGVFGGIGLTDEELREQVDRIAEARDTLAAEGIDVELLHGVEANVDSDGKVTTDDALLTELDLVVASPHAALGQGEATDRLVRAVEHPEVDVLGHPTGRLINERAGLEVDFGRLAEAAAAADTALEVNANPARLDLAGEAVRAAVEAGAPITVNTDAHSTAEFDHLRYGVHTARRGWAEPSDVINTYSVSELRAFLS
ncbi:MAG: DNA polymerase/3'-5' exonuclease PolX, partial [Halobaculum sp.]